MKNAKPYSIFSKIYDSVMDHVNFSDWAKFIRRTIHPFQPGSLLDLGCGTGTLIKEFEEIERKVGLDQSLEMLDQAYLRYPYANYVQGDIRNFQLNQKFDLILCTHDTINYLCGENELYAHFLCVREHLEPNGYYFFDVSSEYNILKNFDGQTIHGNFQNLELTWQNEYDSNTKIITSTLDFYEKDNPEKGRFQEVHVQKFFTNEDIIINLAKAGLEVVLIGSDFKIQKEQKYASLINFLVKPAEPSDEAENQ